MFQALSKTIHLLFLLYFAIISNVIGENVKKTETKLKEEIEYLKKKVMEAEMEKEDGLLEIEVKKKQIEMNREVDSILSEELKITLSEKGTLILERERLIKNLFIPGLGTFNSGGKTKGLITGVMFFSLVTGTFYSYERAIYFQNKVGSLDGNSFFSSEGNYQNKYNYYANNFNFFLFSTFIFYSYNVLDSIFGSGKLIPEKIHSLNIYFIPRSIASIHAYPTETNYSISYTYQF